jgi:hypothetical protein
MVRRIIEAGDNYAISFTDDTSPDTRGTKKRNVSIHAQVRRRGSLNWFYDLLFQCRHVNGEIKGRPHVLDAYKGMNTLARTKLWETLKEVQINIADPLPYQVETSNFYKELTNKKDTIEAVRNRAITKDPVAMRTLELLNNQTAERVLLDAPSQRLSLSLYFAQNPIAIYADKGFSDFLPAMPRYKLEASRLASKNPSSLVRNATEYVAKSASVFSDAIDACFERPYLLHDHPLLNPVSRALRESHGFDRGNKLYIDIMEDEREAMWRQALRRSYFEYDEFEMSPLPLNGEIESKESYYIQASDFAAAISGHLYEQNGIFAVASNFEYVMFNGERIHQNEAYDLMKEWQQMGYYN